MQSAAQGGAMPKEISEAPTDLSDEPDDTVPRVKRDPNRTCSVCGVKLSLYNPGPHCWQHTIGWPYRGPSAKPRF